MANVMRWRYGDTSPVMQPVQSATAIEIGDLLYLATDHVLPAASQADQGSKAANQQLFHNNFAGVAMQQSRVGDTNPIRVATTGVFAFDCASATFEVGALMGISQPSGGPPLDNQVVVGVGAENLAIGRCAKRVNPADVSVLVEVVSTVSHGGPQGKA
ncbi:MAG TPA: hypothetical protein VHD36_08475 [Pirellulales bacterium]|nr:hypothetical protein [Pirellulales bacterium]